MQAAEGNITINLYGMDYPMKFSNRVYNAFFEKTGKDFNALGAELFNEWTKMADLGYFDDDASLDVASCEASARFSTVITKVDAAWLFYLCAKEVNSKVEIGEFEESVTYELFDELCFKNGVTQKVLGDHVTEGYPVLFLQIFMFSMNMIEDPQNIKKNSSNVSFLKKLKSSLWK